MTGADGGSELAPEEAFSILGNETRLAVLQELWDADAESLAFSELRERVGVDDRGNFNYHLGKLKGNFVRRTDAGYELRYAGEEIIRSILKGTITDDQELGPVEPDARCPFCGASVELRYEEDTVKVRCTTCEGIVGRDYPEGTYMHYRFPPAGLEGRTHREVLMAAHTFYDGKITPMMDGVCPECAGRTSVSVEICEDHDPEGICENCNSGYRMWSVYTCTRCGYERQSMVWFRALNHPAVVSFYYRRGGLDETIPFRKLVYENVPYLSEITEEIDSRDPLRIRIAFRYEEHELQVTVDEELNVLETTEQ